MTDFEKKIAIKKSRFGSFYSVKTRNFAFFVLPLKSSNLYAKVSLLARF